jgi:SAM-dependent methyltransferase
MRRSPLARDRYALYEAALRGEDVDLDFFERVYRRAHGQPFLRLREDFCGTALLACSWALRGKGRLAIGVDIDPVPLAWARRNHLARMRRAADRVTLVQGDVRTARTPRADVACALNFSYWIFKTRDELRRYFSHVRRSLRPGGIFFVNAYGGTGAFRRMTETRYVPASHAADGLRVPGFTYVWQQVRFNPITHHILCHIHFRWRDGAVRRRAFTYDWRAWTLPEIQEVMREAGFRKTEVYIEDWNEGPGDTEVVFRRMERFENRSAWLAFIAGHR